MKTNNGARLNNPLLPDLDHELNWILVPIDFSEPARAALRYAISIARRFNAGIMLFHVVPLPAFPGSEPVPMPEAMIYDVDLRKQARKQLLELRHGIGPGIPSKMDVKNGSPREEIVRAARDNGVDLIVLGDRGGSALTRFLLGSTTEMVVRHAHCPVLVIRGTDQTPPEAAATARTYPNRLKAIKEQRRGISARLSNRPNARGVVRRRKRQRTAHR